MIDLIFMFPMLLWRQVLDLIFGKSDTYDYVSTTTPPTPPPSD